MATKYVTQAGDGDNSGSSLANARDVATYNSSGVGASAGDTVNASGTFTSTFNLMHSGSSGNRITYDFTGATLNTASPRIYLNGVSHANIYGGTMGVGATSYIYSSTVNNDNITISGWTHTGTAGHDTLWLQIGAPGAFAQASNLVVENNTITNVAILVALQERINDNITIRNNDVLSSSSAVTPTFDADLIQIASGRNVLIEGNKLIHRRGSDGAYHCDVIQSYAHGGVGAQSPHGWTIRYNWIEAAYTLGDQNNTTIFEDWTASTEGIKFYGNVVINNGSTGTGSLFNSAFEIGADARVRLYNNTFIRGTTEVYGVRLDVDENDVYSQNNIIWRASSADGSVYFGAASPTIVEGNYNWTYNNTDTPASWTGANGSDGVDPELENTGSQQFWPATGSPLIGFGATLASEYEYGLQPACTWPNPTLVQRTGSWDVGAYVMSDEPPATPVFTTMKAPKIKRGRGKGRG